MKKMEITLKEFLNQCDAYDTLNPEDLNDILGDGFEHLIVLNYTFLKKSADDNIAGFYFIHLSDEIVKMPYFNEYSDEESNAVFIESGIKKIAKKDFEYLQEVVQHYEADLKKLKSILSK